MAFVPSPVSLLSRASSFAGAAIDKPQPRAPLARSAALRMAEAPPTGEPGEVGIAGKSMWKENAFAGGFPGGEAFYQAWIEKGMTEDVPDMPKSMQPKSSFKPTATENTGILAQLDATEFFRGFEASAEPAEAPAQQTAVNEAAGEEAADIEAAVQQGPTDEGAPPQELYEQYYPANVRNLAPEFLIRYDKNNPINDRIGLRMTEVTASAADLYFPKQRKNIAPVIDIKYFGSVANASVTVSFEAIEGLPALAPPVAKGEIVTSLVPSAGGGFKLTFDVEGGENIAL